MPTWMIPLSDISFDQAEIDRVVSVLHSGWLSMGEITMDFEKAMVDFLGVKYAFAVTNGTAALHLAYLAVEIQPSDEVILPSLSFVATANAAIYQGAIPVFAEINGFNDLNISPVDIENKISPQTRVISVMHYGGYPVQMDQIMGIAQKYGLSVIEDAAHGPGSSFQKKMIGTIGDIGCFSFFANKNLITGEGGMVVTNNDELAEKIRLLRSHGMTSLTWDRHAGHSYTYDVTDLGYNYRIDEIRSAIGISQLEKITVNNFRRHQITMLYRRELAEIPSLLLPFSNHHSVSANHLFVILLPEKIDREGFMNYMKTAGIQTSIHYHPIHLFQYYRRKYGFQPGLLPLTESAASRLVSLPLYPMMTDEQVLYICKTTKAFFA